MPIRTYCDLEVFKESYEPLSKSPSLQNALRSTSNLSLVSSFGAQRAQFRQTLLRVGRKRVSVPEFKRYLQVAIGSCDEVKFWFQMAKDEGYIPDELVNAQSGRYNKIGAMLAGLWKKWRSMLCG